MGDPFCPCSLLNNMSYFFSILGENTAREGLVKTPQRSADALEFLTSGYNVTIPGTLLVYLFISLEY